MYRSEAASPSASPGLLQCRDHGTSDIGSRNPADFFQGGEPIPLFALDTDPGKLCNATLLLLYDLLSLGESQGIAPLHPHDRCTLLGSPHESAPSKDGPLRMGDRTGADQADQNLTSFFSQAVCIAKLGQTACKVGSRGSGVGRRLGSGCCADRLEFRRRSGRDPPRPLDRSGSRVGPCLGGVQERGVGRGNSVGLVSHRPRAGTKAILLMCVYQYILSRRTCPPFIQSPTTTSKVD